MIASACDIASFLLRTAAAFAARSALHRSATHAPLLCALCPNPPHPQSKKRGLSLEEKRDKVLEVFHESGDVFVLKVRVALLGRS